jgi:hypothetical protein
MKDPRRMSTEELKELMELTQTLLTKREHEEQHRGEEKSRKGSTRGAWVRLERVRCGQKRCRKCCGDGPRHGPYWYAYFYDEIGKMKSRYLGKTLPEEYRHLLPEELG